MSLFRVDVLQTRTASFFVEGNPEQAKEDADILAEELCDQDWNDIDTDVSIGPDENPFKGARIWTGGPSGTFITASQLPGGATVSEATTGATNE